MNNFYLDANGTDGTDPTKVDRVYTDGTRVPLSEPEPVDKVQERIDFADYRATVQAMLSAADDHLDAIATDEAGLGDLLGFPTLLQYKQQWARTYDREREQVIGMKRVLAALMHLTPKEE